MKKIRIWFKIIIKSFKRYWLVVTLSIISGILFFFLASNFVKISKKIFPQTPRIGLVGNYKLTNLPPEVSHYVSHGLTEILPNGKATSSPIVKNWGIQQVGLEYVFTFKKALKWQDGTPLRPDQINYEIEGAETIPIKNGVKFKLESPFSPLPTLLNKPLYKKKKIGLGEYKVRKYQTTAGMLTSLTVQKTDNRRQKIKFYFYPQEEDLLTAFKLGEINTAWKITNLSEVKDWPNVKIQSRESTPEQYSALFINTRNNPLKQKKFRQALAYAIEKSAEKDRAVSPIAPNSWAYEKDIKTYDFDPNHAKNLMEDIGNFENQEFTLHTLPELLDLAEQIEQNWEENLNLKIQIKVTSFIPSENKFNIFLGYGIIPNDPDQYYFWHSTQQGNITGIDNDRIDDLLERGRKTTDYQERTEIYQEFQKAISEEVPAIFLYYPTNYTLVRN
jgi:ABC-type transport system substrate-binding protein